MNKKLPLLALSLLGCQNLAMAQTAADYAIQVEATVNTTPPSVTLNWKKIPGTTQYNIFKKTKGATAWASMGSTPDTFFTDASAMLDTAFEYRVSNTGGSIAAGGHALAGINSPALHQKGNLILVVDTLFRDSCAAEIQQYMKDLNADGWGVKRINVRRDTPDSLVKKSIKEMYSQYQQVKAVMILGHVAVPYSGDLNPDAHPDHKGAWPADVYYADMDDIWTDVSVNNSVATRAQNKNIPGDGKWDQSTLPSQLELQVGRIDFFNMGTFSKTEVELMKSYLAKAHRYKMDSLYISKKAVVDDNFGAFSGEAFAANAWRNFSPLIGRSNIKTGDLLTTMNDSAYQWAYGCGAGSYTSCSGVGTTNDFKGKAQKGIFTILFGSYFGDWDSQNNLLRAPLCCSEPALASFWAGRPNWFFHQMALGENIGYSAFWTQNNGYPIYAPVGYMYYGVHVALMGDLSLRTEYIKPASMLSITPVPKKGANISWTASPDAAVIGYYVYRSDSLYGLYSKVSDLIAGTTFADTIGKDGLKYYMVRPCKLQSTPSGTYYNLGLGISDTATVSFPIPSSIQTVKSTLKQMHCFPNPANDQINLYLHLNELPKQEVQMKIMDLAGKTILSQSRMCFQNELTISENIQGLSTGTYIISLSVGNEILRTTKFLKQ